MALLNDSSFIAQFILIGLSYLLCEKVVVDWSRCSNFDKLRISSVAIVFLSLFFVIEYELNYISPVTATIYLIAFILNLTHYILKIGLDLDTD